MRLNPKLSVVMPVFNGEAYLEKAIDSVLTQTFKAFEFLIVNDGSKDKTAEILDQYARQDDRIKIYTHEKNRGIVDSLNRGLVKAGTKYIARMDADDICALTRLEEQYDFLEKNKDHVLVATQAKLMDAEEHITGETHFPAGDTDIRKELFHGRNVIFHSTVLFRNDFQLLYRNDAYPAEDYDLWLRLLEKGKVHLLDKRLMYYRLNPEGVSFVNAIRQMEMTERIKNKVLLKREVDKTPSGEPGSLKKIHSKWLQKMSRAKFRSPKWFLLKMLTIFLSPSDLLHIKKFRWIEKYSHYRDYLSFVYGFREGGEAK
jgi:glycosyltransferase involved in cell wall biosynthesis